MLAVYEIIPYKDIPSLRPLEKFDNKKEARNYVKKNKNNYHKIIIDYTNPKKGQGGEIGKIINIDEFEIPTSK